MNLRLFVYLQWVLRLTHALPSFFFLLSPVFVSAAINILEVNLWSVTKHLPVTVWDKKMVFWGTEFYHFLLPNTIVSVWTCPPHTHWSQGLLSFTSPSLLPLFNNVRFLDEMLFYIWKEWFSAVTASSAWLLVALICTSRWVIIRRGWLSRVLIWFESWIERKRVNQHKEMILHWLATDKLPAHWIRWNSCPVTIAIIAHSVLLVWITRSGHDNFRW